jgi:hypothetical protein
MSEPDDEELEIEGPEVGDSELEELVRPRQIWQERRRQVRPHRSDSRPGCERSRFWSANLKASDLVVRWSGWISS